ncbi:MAG: hypothetical protein L6R39_004737, partial [Caloplaca ligustica]
MADTYHKEMPYTMFDERLRELTDYLFERALHHPGSPEYEMTDELIGDTMERFKEDELLAELNVSELRDRLRNIGGKLKLFLVVGLVPVELTV